MEDRLSTKFIKEISRIKDPTVFLGVARILKVELMVDKDTPKDFAAVLNEIIDNYNSSDRKRRRELLKILEKSNKCKEDVRSGNSTQSPAETIPNKEV